MRRICKESAGLNAASASFSQHDLDVLLTGGQYSDLTVQTTYDPAVCALVAAVAIKAWKSLSVEQENYSQKLYRDLQSLILHL